jgi:poly(ADP-ribose) glycohydrolase
VPRGVVTYERRILTEVVDWANDRTPLTRVRAMTDGLIEDGAPGLLEMDFANMYLGGGAIGRVSGWGPCYCIASLVEIAWPVWHISL